MHAKKRCGCKIPPTLLCEHYENVSEFISNSYEQRSTLVTSLLPGRPFRLEQSIGMMNSRQDGD
jgi:hypothetical protein